MLFTTDVKLLWEVMPMGSLNADPTFLTMAMKILKIMVHIRKGVQSEKHHIKNNCLWYFTLWITSEQILEYFRKVLDILKHHRYTINLKRYKWFQHGCNFVDMDVA